MRLPALMVLALALSACVSTPSSSLRGTGIPRAEVERIERDPSRMRVVESVIKNAEHHGVPVNLALAVTYTESRMRVRAIGPSTAYGRAYGPLQVLLATARGIDPSATPGRLMSYDAGPRIGVAYLARGFREQGGDPCRTAMRYHGGPNRAIWGRRTHAYCRDVVSRL